MIVQIKMSAEEKRRLEKEVELRDELVKLLEKHGAKNISVLPKVAKK